MPLPTPAEARVLHQRLIADDPTASSDIAEAYLDWLATELERRYPWVDPHLCTDAAIEALVTYFGRPQVYDPERGALQTYLRMAAVNDLKNAQAKDRRHTSRQATLEAVELSPSRRKYLQDTASDPAAVIDLQETIRERAEQQAVPPAVAETLAPEEAQVLTLMREGERKTAVYASVLGIEHLAPAEQRREVKRVKDRLTKRLERGGA